MNSIDINRESGKIYSGIALLVIGSLFMVRNVGADLPAWLLSWPMLLIAIGIVSGVKHQFTRPAAYVLIVLGAVFLLKKFFLISISLFPLLLIGIGLWIIIRNKPLSISNQS